MKLSQKTGCQCDMVNGHLPVGAKVVRQVVLLDKFREVAHPESGAAHRHVALSHLVKGENIHPCLPSA